MDYLFLTTISEMSMMMTNRLMPMMLTMMTAMSQSTPSKRRMRSMPHTFGTTPEKTHINDTTAAAAAAATPTTSNH